MSINVEIKAGEKGAKFAASKKSIAIVIDVLRASTTITTILEMGAAKVIPVREVEEAENIRSNNRDFLLAGERNNLKPQGFDFGNSPLEYLNVNLENKTVVFTSSNCTRVLLPVISVPFLALACYRNIQAVAKWCNIVYKKHNLDIVIIPANTGVMFSDEDFHCALSLKQMIEAAAPPPREDETKRIINYSFHGRNLGKSGFSDDLTYAAAIGKASLVPVYSIEENAFCKQIP
ncbi:MAG: 2-phosphosulfolactate phosphatase [Promethearchaeota archaeon]